MVVEEAAHPNAIVGREFPTHFGRHLSVELVDGLIEYLCVLNVSRLVDGARNLELVLARFVRTAAAAHGAFQVVEQSAGWALPRQLARLCWRIFGFRGFPLVAAKCCHFGMKRAGAALTAQ